MPTDPRAVPQVIFVEDDPDVLKGASQALRLAGLEVAGFACAEGVLDAVSRDFPGIVVSDVLLPGMDGMALLRRLVEVDVQLPVILATGHGDINMAVDAMRLGAYDFVEKPYSSEDIVGKVRRALDKRRLILENRELRASLENRRGIEQMLLGNTAQMERLRALIADVADTDVAVLVCGETGTGKELVARSLHLYSRRRDANFVPINCGALPETLFESELFGHEAGAFTGAAKRRIGKVEHANGGTLFLDEIESMPPSLQVKLLRVLQEHTIERLGSNDALPVDSRLVAATKEDLAKLSEQGNFRSDLYFRLNVVCIELPPLRERREDVPLLFESFVLQAAARYQREAPVLSPERMRTLMSYAWPGNVRELRNVADRLVLGLVGDGLGLPGAEPREGASLSDLVDGFEKTIIEQELRRRGGKVADVSESLRVPKKTLYDKLRKHGLSTDEFR